MIAVERQHVIFEDSFEDEWDIQIHDTNQLLCLGLHVNLLGRFIEIPEQRRAKLLPAG